MSILRTFATRQSSRLSASISIPANSSSSFFPFPSQRTLSSTSIAFSSLPAPSSSSSSSPPKPYFITTPIFYVNAVPHVGHLHSMLLADTIARFARLQVPSRPVHFSTGTDEHGLKIQNAARDKKMTPKAMCDQNSQRFRDLAEVANISYTTFIRTTEERHRAAVQHFWNRLVERGYIYKGSHSGWYAVSDECFYPETQIKDAEDGSGAKVSIESGARVEWTEEENYKFRLSDFREPLIEWLRLNPEAVSPTSHYTSLLADLHSSASANQDLSVSRPASRLTWGIPVPGDETHTIYVWVDALINYLTVLGYPVDSEGVVGGSWDVEVGGGLEKVERMGWPADVQIVGKDIVKFHAVYWPALLMALSLPPPRTVLVHAHWLQGNVKMSKSLGNVADPFEAIQRAGVDSVRAYLMGVGGRLSNDSDYSYPALLQNHKLYSDQIGNLISRLSGKKVTGRLLAALDEENASRSSSSSSTSMVDVRPEEIDQELDSAMRVVRDKVEAAMLDHNPSEAMFAVMQLISEANKLYSDRSPWSSSQPSLHQCYIYTVQTLRIAAILLSPVLPTKMEELLDMMCVPTEQRTWESALWVGKSEEAGVLARRVVEGARRRKEEGKKKVLFERIFEEGDT